MEAVFLEVQDPHLGDARLGVKGKLKTLVVLQARFGHLHQEEHVLGGGKPLPIAFGPEKGQVGLGFGVGGMRMGFCGQTTARSPRASVKRRLSRATLQACLGPMGLIR